MSASILSRVQPTRLIGTVAVGGLAIGLASTLLVRNAYADAGAPPKIFNGGPAFVSLPLESSELVNHNTKRLRFKLPQPDAVSGLSLTSALLTVSWPEGRWTPVARPYTPVSSHDEPGYIEFLVKKYPDGKSSTHLHSLTPGQSLRFPFPIKGHQWKPNSYRHVTLVAGGAGITPVYQLARGILENSEDKTAMTLVFGVNSDQDVLLKKEFEQFEKEYPGRFKAIYTVSNPVAGSPFRKGYVTKELLEEVTPSPGDSDTKIFLCGPPAMEKALVGSWGNPGVLQQLGYRKDQIVRF